MKIELWVDGTLVEAKLKKNDFDSFMDLLYDVKRYEKPIREPDFKHQAIEFYIKEGMAFINSSNQNWKRTYEAFYNAKQNKVGLRQIDKKRSKKMTNYKTGEVVKKYLNAVADNVMLNDMEEPKDFGKVPRLG